MRNPRRWLAIALSIPAPGLGHLYCGRYLAAGIAALAIEVLAVPASRLIQTSPTLVLILTARG